MRRTLKQARKASGKKQKEIAAAIGISESHYKAIENGAREGKAHIWNALEDLFGIPQRQLREDS